VAARGVIQSPVLVGRDEFIELARRRLGEAAAGSGHLLFVAGEAGIGKTRLLGAIARQAQIDQFTVVRAAAFPGDAESSAGLLIDVASELAQSEDQVLATAGRTMADRLRTGAGDEGDAHRRRRLLVQDVVDLWPVAGTPMLVVLEDLHWADQLSLDMVSRLAGRLSHRAVLVAGAYRSDELYPRVPMRELRNRLLAQRQAEEIRLRRLSLDETGTLTSTVLGYQPSAQALIALQARSDGIPLHIEELLATMDDAALAGDHVALEHATAVPETLADAVLARFGTLPPATRQIAAAAAVIGRSFDFDLLTTVTGAGDDEVAAALRALQDAYFVLPGTDPATYDFRHALIRAALYADTDLPTRRRLHERVADTAAERGYRHGFISAHYEQAEVSPRSYQHALIAAREAVEVSAHSEALDLFRRALRHEPEDATAADRAELRIAVGDEAAATDENEAAVDAYQQALELFNAEGNRRAAAAVAPRLVAAQHLLGAGLQARVDVLRAAQAGLRDLDAELEMARLDSAIAAAYMLDRRLDQAIGFGAPARSASARIGDERTEVNTAATLGAVYVFAGRMDEGWELLEDAVRRSAAAGQEAEAARCYRIIGTSASVLVEYDRAEHWLNLGIRYADRVELWNHRHYMASHLAHVQWATGDWAAAARTAEHALADGRGGITTRITALYVLGYLALGRGEWSRAETLLDEAYADGVRMAELQRLSPPLWGLAELARCRGDLDRAITLCERGYEASAEVTDAAYLFPFLLTGVRAHLARDDRGSARAWLDRVEQPLRTRSIPGTMPALDHARALILIADGEPAAARPLLDAAGAAWDARRRWWEGAWARLDRAALALKARRRAEAARILDEAATLAADAGAKALVDEATTRRSTTENGRPAEPWHPLTAREFEVARLVADGLTNREIAGRLVLAPKTVSAHVEHILTKLGASRRTEIAAWVARVPSGS